MSLPEPPCIEFFVGCYDTYSGGDGSSTSSSSHTSQSTGNTAGDGSGSTGNSDENESDVGEFNGTTGFQNSVGSSASSVSHTASSFATAVGTETQRLAKYSVTVLNRGKEAVQGFVFAHGPLPSGAVFDPLRSSPGCMQVGQEVQCTVQLGAGESKSVELAYKVNNAVSCAIVRALQTVKNMTGDTANGVSTSVSCTMKTVTGDEDVLSFSSSSSFYSSSSASSFSFIGTQSGVVAGDLLGDGQGAVTLSSVATDAIGLTFTGDKDIKGSKPVPMPRTGAADLLFSTQKQDYVLTAVRHEAADTSILTFSWIGAVVLAVLSIKAVRAMRRQLA